MVTMSPVVHFEMPAEDTRRMASFYEKTFGWKTQMLGPDMGDYVLVTAAESDEKAGAPAGAINGGLFRRSPTGQRNTRRSSSGSMTSNPRCGASGKRAARFSVSRCRFPALDGTFRFSTPRATVLACYSPIAREPRDYGRRDARGGGVGISGTV